MPPLNPYQEQLNRAQSSAQQRAGTAETNLRDLNAALSRVRDGDLSDIQVDDPLLQTTLDEYDKSIADLDKSAYQTDQYQALARGAYSAGARGGRRLLAEGRDQINIQLSQLQLRARQQRVNAIAAYRDAERQNAANERALALQIGQDAYNTELSEEERKIRQDNTHREKFMQQILNGEEITADFIAQYAESAGRDVGEIQALVQEAGNRAINSYRQIAEQEGITLNDEDIDYSSDSATVNSIRNIINKELKRRRDFNEEQVRKDYNLRVEAHKRNIERDRQQKHHQDESRRLQKARLDAELRQGQGGASGCMALESIVERADCLVREATTISLHALPESLRQDGDVRTFAKSLHQRYTATGELTNQDELNDAVRRTIGDPGFARAYAEQNKDIPEIQAALEGSDADLISTLERIIFGNAAQKGKLSPIDVADFYYRSAHMQQQENSPEYRAAIEAAKESAEERGILPYYSTPEYLADFERTLAGIKEMEAKGETPAVSSQQYLQSHQTILEALLPEYDFGDTSAEQYLDLLRALYLGSGNSASLSVSSTGIPNPTTISSEAPALTKRADDLKY